MSNDPKAASSNTDEKTVSTPMPQEDLEQVAGGMGLMELGRSKKKHDSNGMGNAHIEEPAKKFID